MATLLRVLAVLIFPLGTLVLVTVQGTMTATDRADVASDADHTLQMIGQLVELQSAVADESLFSFILQHEAQNEQQVLAGIFEAGGESGLEPARNRTDVALLAMSVEDRPFVSQDLRRVRQTIDLNRQDGTPSRTVFAFDIEQPLAESIAANLLQAQRSANQLNDSELYDAVTILEARMNAYLASTRTLADLATFWFADTTEDASTRATVASSQVQLDKALDRIVEDTRFTSLDPEVEAPGFEKRVNDARVGQTSPLRLEASAAAGDPVQAALDDLAEGFERNDALAMLINDTASEVKLLVEARRVIAEQQAWGNSALAGSATIASLATAIWFTMSIVTAENNRDELEKKLVHQASVDYLTGLPNRRFAMKHLGELIESTRSGPGYPAVIFLDLDQFKWVNDTLGHKVGDDLLIEVASRLREAVRPGDTPARLGGDEFLVVLDSCKGLDQLRHVAKRIVGELSAAYNIGKSDLSLSSSAGLALADQGQDASTLLYQADAAAYSAKASDVEGDIVAYAGQLQEHIESAKEIESELTEALNSEVGLSVVYQPILHASGAVSGFEALLRWRRTNGELVPPGVFIPIAEESDLVTRIDRWVLNRALEDLKVLRTGTGFDRLTMSVNFSGRHLVERSFVANIKKALQATGLASSALIVEVTETVLVKDTNVAAANLAGVRALGCRVSIDDFGTGYTSINQLLHFPADELKIDRSLTGDEETLNQMVPLVVKMANALKLATVAEGIETEVSAAAVRAIGCDHLQGYFFARPMKLDDATVWVRTNADRSLEPKENPVVGVQRSL